MFRYMKRTTNCGTATVSGQKVNRGAGYGLEIPVTYEFTGDEFSINWLQSKINV